MKLLDQVIPPIGGESIKKDFNSTRSSSAFHADSAFT